MTEENENDEEIDDERKKLNKMGVKSTWDLLTKKKDKE